MPRAGVAFPERPGIPSRSRAGGANQAAKCNHSAQIARWRARGLAPTSAPEEDGGHPARAELVLDAVAVAKGGGEAGGEVGHGG